jgi:hypothetical protein
MNTESSIDERQQALSDRLKEIAEQIATRNDGSGEISPKLANIANTCPTDPAELAMCDSCQ